MGVGLQRIDLINRALLKFGDNSVANPTDQSEQARSMALVFDSVAREELRRQAWSFALARTALPADAAAPAWGYLKSYTLPADCLRVVQVSEWWVNPQSFYADYNDAPNQPFVIEQGKILTNDGAPLKVRYVRDLTQDSGSWDSAFVGCFCCRLAHEVSYKRTKNLRLKSSLRDDYLIALADAKRTNAIELPPQAQLDGSWLEARVW